MFTNPLNTPDESAFPSTRVSMEQDPEVQAEFAKLANNNYFSHPHQSTIFHKKTIHGLNEKIAPNQQSMIYTPVNTIGDHILEIETT